MDSELKSLLGNEESISTKSKHFEDKYQSLEEIEKEAERLFSSCKTGVWKWFVSWIIGCFITGIGCAASSADGTETIISISIVSSILITVGVLNAIKLGTSLLSNILQMQILDFKVKNGINDISNKNLTQTTDQKEHILVG